MIPARTTARLPRARALIAGLAVLFALLAGCGEKAQTQVEVAGQIVELEEPLKPGNGIVAGIVGDDAIYPLPGAVIRIMGLELSATSNDNGQFAIVDVPPGIYILEGSKKDHKSVQTTVDVQPDKVAKAVLLLERVPPTDPYHITFPHEGHVELGGAYGSGGLNSNTSFGFSLDDSQAVTVVLESKWTGTFVATGQREPLVYTITDVGFRIIAEDEATNPFVLHLDARVLAPHKLFTVSIEQNRPDPLVVYQAHSKDFVTVFYNEPAPPGWSILDGST